MLHRSAIGQEGHANMFQTYLSALKNAHKFIGSEFEHL